MIFTIDIPTQNGKETIEIEAGSSLIFVGANGTGKTKLATHIEELLNLSAHRIAAHRALSLNPKVPKISEDEAFRGLRIGYTDERFSQSQASHRRTGRWKNQGSVTLLNDFDFLLQTLFAEQANTALKTHNKVRNGDNSPATATKFEILKSVWERLISHRQLHISGDNIQVSSFSEEALYSGSAMSDGERAIFYMLGQTLVAKEDSLIIFDEPELHVHRSIMAKLWDELEAIRPDCAFVFITHDLEFASSRVADKYVIREYTPQPYWNIAKVPIDSGFDEELLTLILGSRKPILFVEGASTSLDRAIYRSCFPDWTIVPKGSCSEVIHSVVTMRKNQSLTRITCSGIVDADGYNQEDQGYLEELGIATLPVSEIENIILLPSVSQAIAQYEGYMGNELTNKLHELSEAIFSKLNPNTIEDVVVRYCVRRIDNQLKKIDLSLAQTVSDLCSSFSQKTQSLDIQKISREITSEIDKAKADRNLRLLLANYDGGKKELLALAASHLKGCRRKSFESWLVRVLANNDIPELVEALKKSLPNIQPQ